MAGNKKVLLLLAAAIFSAVVGICSAATLTVGGDTTGWTIPPSQSFYTTWASKQKLKVGDSLVFPFQAGMHTVAEVSKAAYDSCSSANPLSAVLSTAPANITIRTAGTHYYICTVTGHCSSGQKLAIVAAASSASAPAPKSSKPKKAASPAPAPSTTAAAPATSPTAPAAKAPAGSTPGTAAAPSGNFAAPNAAGFGFLGLISVAAAAALLI